MRSEFPYAFLGLVFVFLSCGRNNPEMQSLHSNENTLWIYEDGGMLNGLKVEGLKEGTWIYYYSSTNTPHKLGSYKNGIRSGIWRTFSKSGTLKAAGFFAPDTLVHGAGITEIIGDENGLEDVDYYSPPCDLKFSLNSSDSGFIQQGLWIVFDSLGNPDCEVLFELGIIEEVRKIRRENSSD